METYNLALEIVNVMYDNIGLLSLLTKFFADSYEKRKMVNVLNIY